MHQQKFKLKCQGYLAALMRRQGNLSRAEALFGDLVNSFMQAQQLADAGRQEYEVAYLHFLRGDLGKAAEWFDRSYEHALEGRDRVGAWIGRCLGARVRFLAGELNPPKFREVLEQARDVFEKAAVGPNPDPRALRWKTSNIAGHIFEVAYQEQNGQLALRCFEELQQDEWASNYGRDTRLLPYRARLSMLNGDWNTAVEHFKNFLPHEHQTSMQGGEARACAYLDYGLALARAGAKEQATEVWQLGLECPDELGNTIWKEKIRQAMEEHRPVDVS